MKYTISEFLIAGFATENAKGGDNVNVLNRAFRTSNDSDFYGYIGHISRAIFNKIKLPVAFVSRFMVIIHSDKSADVYVNDFETIHLVRLKNKITNRQEIYASDIAGLEEINFPQITIKETDGVIYCFKVGWKFGLYFDFTALANQGKLDVKQLNKALAFFYTLLSYEDVYKTLEAQPLFEGMTRDGWFPFIQLLGGDFEALSECYINKFNYESRINLIIDKYTSATIEEISSKWWNDKAFNAKKGIISAGLASYRNGDKSGYINSIKNLYSEIEGVLQKSFSPKLKLNVPDLIAVLKRNSPKNTLFFVDQFTQYLEKFLFKNFDYSTGDIALSRHSVVHGLAEEVDYTKIHAFQAILILDQIYYYINEINRANINKEIHDF